MMFVTAKQFGALSFQIDNSRITATSQNLELRITLYFKINEIHTLCFTCYLVCPANLYATFFTCLSKHSNSYQYSI